MPPLDRGSTLADEVRQINADIRRLECEIAKAQAAMTPEELAQNRAEHEECVESLDGLELDEQIRVLKAEIALLEADDGGGDAE
jgi:hypothetical protein